MTVFYLYEVLLSRLFSIEVNFLYFYQSILYWSLYTKYSLHVKCKPPINSIVWFQVRFFFHIDRPPQQLLWPHCVLYDCWIPTNFQHFYFSFRSVCIKLMKLTHLLWWFPVLKFQNFILLSLSSSIFLHWPKLSLIEFVILGLTHFYRKVGFSKCNFPRSLQKPK